MDYEEVLLVPAARVFGTVLRWTAGHPPGGLLPPATLAVTLAAAPVQSGWKPESDGFLTVIRR